MRSAHLAHTRALNQIASASSFTQKLRLYGREVSRGAGRYSRGEGDCGKGGGVGAHR